MKPLRVAVTGGSGRIGHQLVKLLVARGHQVVNLDRRQAPEAVGRFVYADLCRREQIQPILETVDAVCHLGEIPNVELPYSPDHIFAHNTAAGSVVMQTAADLKLQRVIYTSSCQVYGVWGLGHIPPAVLPMDESHPLRPQQAYALSKVANETYAAMVARQSGMSVALFRFPWVTDWKTEDLAGQWEWFEKRSGKNEGCCTYVHVSDAVQAYVLALENPRPGCEAYHFAAKEVMSSQPIRERQLKYHPDYPTLAADWPTYKSPVLTDKAREHFGWQPTWNLLDHYRAKFGRDPLRQDSW